jgi:hypothetical protein
MESIIVIAILFAILYWVGWKWIAGIVALIGVGIALAVYLSNKREKERRKEMLTKYLGDIETVDRIMSQQVWEGQTSEQLFDSLGPAVEIDEKILKTKSKEIWKYNQTGKGRFALRVTLENNEVVGWEKKN